VLIAFGGGVMAGGVLYEGLTVTFTPTLYGLGGAALVVLLSAGALSTRGGVPESEKRAPLPDEVCGGGQSTKSAQAPEPESSDEPTSRSNRSSASSSTSKLAKQRSFTDGETGGSGLEAKLDEINKQLQRANVKLGLGELSEEGYERIVDELKQDRAKIEAKMDRKQRSDE